MKHTKQAGISTTVVLVAVFLVAALGVGGYVAYSRATGSSDSSQPTASKTDNGPKTTPLKAYDGSLAGAATLKYNALPSDLRKAILALYKEKAPGCVEGTKLSKNGQELNPDVAYASNGFAQLEVGCDGGSKALMAKSNQTWKTIATTQSLYSCSVLQQYQVPSALGITSCTDSINGRTTAYKN